MPKVTIKSVNKPPLVYNLDQDLSITWKRNTYATTTFGLPNIVAIDQIGANAEVLIEENGKVLFSGNIEEDGFDQDNYIVTAYGDFYKFTKETRSFTQIQDDITASDALTNAFDQDETFDYFLSEYRDQLYTTPFQADWDVKTYVVDCDLAETFSDFFNLSSGDGLKFMGQLATSAYKGTTYRYFYWHETIGNQKYIHFEPDGYGKVHTIDESEMMNLTIGRKFKNVWNDIVVLGKRIRGYIPNDQDAWTEKFNVDRYDSSTNATMDSTRYIVGLQSLLISINNVDDGGVKISLETVDGYLDLEMLKTVQYYYYVTDKTFIDVYCRIYDADGDYVEYMEQDAELTADAWTLKVWNKMDFTTESGTFDWNNISHCWLLFQQRDVGGVQECWFDGFHFDIGILRSGNTNEDTGYSSDSEEEFGLRRTTINFTYLNSVAKCNQRAKELLSYFKSIEYNGGFSLPYFKYVRLNENVKSRFYRELLTLPIDSIIWSWTGNGGSQTDIGLGTPRLTRDKVLKKFSTELEAQQWDQGLVYKVF